MRRSNRESQRRTHEVAGQERWFTAVRRAMDYLRGDGVRPSIWRIKRPEYAVV